MIEKLTFKIDGVTYVERPNNGCPWSVSRNKQGVYYFKYEVGPFIFDAFGPDRGPLLDFVQNEIAGEWHAYVMHPLHRPGHQHRRKALMKAFKQVPAKKPSK